MPAKHLVLFLCLQLMATMALAQTEAQAGDELLIAHQVDSGLSATVHIDQNMRVWTADHKKYTARLKEVKDSSFVMGTQEVRVASVVKIRAYSKPLGVRKVKTWARRSLWPIGGGLLIGIVGVLVAAAASQVAGVLLLVLGALVAFIGLSIAFFSLVVLMNDNTPATTFKLSKDWLLKVKRKR